MVEDADILHTRGPLQGTATTHANFEPVLSCRHPARQKRRLDGSFESTSLLSVRP